MFSNWHKAWPQNTSCWGWRFVPALSHATSFIVRRLRAGVTGEGRKRPKLTAASPALPSRHLKAQEACLPSSEGSDKCNHTV